MQPSSVRPFLTRILWAFAVGAAACGSGGEDQTYTVTRDSTEWTERYPQPSLGDTAFGSPDDDSAAAPEPTPPPEKHDEKCDPNYDPCVPIDSDVDCAGGRGNGPSYVHGPVRVIGRDIYKLDRDGDGIGCDRG